MTYTILVADQDQGVVDTVEDCLKREGYSVHKALSGAEALEFALQNSVDLALVGQRFSDVDGKEVYDQIKQSGPQPVIMIESGDSLMMGHAFYADGHLVKPISEDELLALVRAHLAEQAEKPGGGNPGDTHDGILEVADLMMDGAQHTCVFMGKELHLTPKEFAILWKLAEAKGGVVRNDDMYRAVWGEEYYGENDNTIAVHIRRLRKKMADAGASYRSLSIQTVWSMGYKLSYSLAGT